MEAVVVNEGRSGGEIIFFSKLKSLELRHLPRLKSFYKEKKDMHSSATSIMDKSVISSGQPQPLFDEMVAFQSLEELFLEDLEDTSDIWGKYYNDNVSSFCRLKSLKVLQCNKLETFIQLSMLHRLRNLECIVLHDCDSLRNAFQPSIARDLMHLREMFVAGCEMMREIIGAGEQEITDAIVFTELKLLCLENLPNLTRFWCYQSEEANNYKVVIPNLVALTIRWATFSLEEIRLGIDDSACQLMQLLVHCGKETQLPSNWLLNLESLSLHHWPSELKSVCFQRLKVLEVCNSDCSNLFTFSAFKSLQQLQTLAISNSAFFQEIVVDVRGEEASVMDKKTVILSQLKSVTLRNLPNLKSFIHCANFECRMPALTEVKVDNCGFSTLFTCCVFRKLQQLRHIQVSNCRLLEEIVEDVGVDKTYFTSDQIVTNFQLTSIDLRDMPNLKSFSRTASYALNLPNLRLFRLHGCPQIENFTFLKTSTGLISVDTEWHKFENFPDLNEYIRRNRERGSSLSDIAGESSYSYQELATKSERVEEEKPQETVENDQPL